jgi:acyl carrier protein
MIVWMPFSGGQAVGELQTIKDIIARAFFIPASTIADDTNISDIKGMDSLSFEALLLEIERVTGEEPDPVALMQVRTVSDLAQLIQGMADQQR